MPTKLIIAIVQDEDASRLIAELMNEGFSATKLATTGGFLRSGNTTLLVGVSEEDLQEPPSGGFQSRGDGRALRPLHELSHRGDGGQRHGVRAQRGAVHQVLIFGGRVASG